MRRQSVALGAGDRDSICPPWKDRIPLEMLGRTRFPAIGELPYMITLAPYGFYWFQLQERDKSEPVDAARGARIRDAGGAAELDLGVAGARARRVRARCAAGPSGADPLVSGAIGQGDPADAGFGGSVLRHRRQPALARVFRDDAARRHHALRAADADRMGALRPRALQSAVRLPPCARARAKARCSTSRPTRSSSRLLLRNLSRIPRRRGRRTGLRLEFKPTSRFSDTAIKAAGAHPRGRDRAVEQHGAGRRTTMSSRSIASWKTASIPRSRWAASSPTSRASPTRRPCSAASNWSMATSSSAIGIVHAFVANQGDAWAVTAGYLDRFVDEQRLLAASDHPGESEEQVPYLRYMSQTGRRTRRDAHRARRPQRACRIRAGADAARGRAALDRRYPGSAPSASSTRSGNGATALKEADRPLVDQLLALQRDPAGSPRRAAAARDRRAQHPPSRRLPSRADADRQGRHLHHRFRGRTRGARIAERRRKAPAARDVAGLIRSIDYSATAALERALKVAPTSRAGSRRRWPNGANGPPRHSLAAYRETMANQRLWPADPAIRRTGC